MSHATLDEPYRPSTEDHSGDTRTASSRDLTGVIVVLQTPFLDTLEMDESSLCREIDFVIQCKANGIVWPVAASELCYLSESERIRGAELIAKCAKGIIPFVIGTSGPNKFVSIAYAQHADSIGADAIIMPPPVDVPPSDPRMFAEIIAAVAEHSSIPICVQTSMPGIPSQLPPEFLVALSRKIRTLRYIKEEQLGFGSLPHRISRYRSFPELCLQPFGGAGGRNLLNEMSRGSAGTMPGAGFADIAVQIWTSYVEGNHTHARHLFGLFLQMAVLEQSTGYVLQKEILCRRGVFRTVHMRGTRALGLDDADAQELSAILELVSPFMTTFKE